MWHEASQTELQRRQRKEREATPIKGVATLKYYFRRLLSAAVNRRLSNTQLVHHYFIY
jgi:hypothetical protein